MTDCSFQKQLSNIKRLNNILSVNVLKKSSSILKMLSAKKMVINRPTISPSWQDGWNYMICRVPPSLAIL